MSEATDQIKITGEPNLDPRYCRFIVDRPILPGGTFFCTDPEMAKGSPLLESLMAIQGIEQVSVTGSSFTFQKSNETAWPVLGKKIGTTIREQLQADGPLFSPELEAKFGMGAAPVSITPNPDLDQDPRGKEIIRLLDEQINPAVSSHGGNIELIDLKGDIAYIRMTGGCQGCAQSKATLKHGVEVAIKQQVPSVVEVVDVTDHASGVNPYFQ